MEVFLPDWLYYYIPELIYNDAQNWTSFYLNLFSNIISAISCLVIFYVIFRSKERLRTTYHRIIAFFTTFIFISNISVGAGTLPMPKDNVYPFKGPMLGNDATCTAQGFAVTFAQLCYLPCNAWLAMYYVCVLVLKLEARTISRFIEPLFYLFSIVSSLTVSLIYLKDEFYHADPLNAYCYTSRYPFHCTWVPDGVECFDNGSFLYTEKGFDVNNASTLYYVYAVFGILIICMFAIIINTFIFEKSMRVHSTSSAVQDSNATTSPNVSASQDTNSRTIEAANTSQDNGTTLAHLKFSRIVALQATLYILSFFIIYIPTVIALATDGVEEGAGVYSRIFLTNFEGFFILCIFLYHKVHNMRRSKKRSDMSICEALSVIFFSGENHDDVFLENLSMVQLEIDDVRERRAAMMEAAMMEIEMDEITDEKAGSVEAEKYEGLSFASPAASYNLGDAVSSVGVSFAPESLGASVPSRSTNTPQYYKYQSSKENESIGVSLPSQSTSGRKYYDDDFPLSYGGNSSC
ncbi:hypothetical protein CTEN210_00275 [Chaetoceros tenuissimus]|uniref:Uncharacterized protein n=1 Tax=Chaetoceros tenuissimus TaxID=426638 RepID=A0AAD3GY91_9STRA|nr:hypothetical protein CTEN210_00275 [Chaetoceros tenuissimus]